jgi:hypothetical protein
MAKRKNQETLGEVIERIVDLYRLRGGLTQASIVEQWPKIVGTQVAQRTDEVLLRGPKLIIRVSNAALRHELHFQREQIRQNVNEFLGAERVKEILLQ